MSLALTVFLVAWIAGLIGTFVPVVPATLIIFVGTVAATWIDGFQWYDWLWLGGVGVVTVLISLVDNVTSGWGARRFGGSKSAMWGAVIGSVAGIFLPFGLVLGPLGGAFLAEIAVERRSLPDAARAAWGTLLGLLAGIAAKFFLHVLIGLVEIARLVWF
ncbi:DUF456 domain-containing protein [Deinococcus yavapaiensis]|uniref:DUF456 domain-containing protein n=1 Tax=Deinococcus yavapaiensis KR-236 TaxID=694435 RepID=A0A318SA03_9DEIO|nr:DUF456 family protein [Deinococcus yavapaiensis]PYE53064.1 hypothetical protein DES52_11047 [Deinococcus yavapaiensis KR-236]